MSTGNSTYTLKATNAYGDTVELSDMNLADAGRYADRLKATGIVPVVTKDNAPMSVDRYYPVRIAQDGTKIRSGGTGPLVRLRQRQPGDPRLGQPQDQALRTDRRRRTQRADPMNTTTPTRLKRRLRIVNVTALQVGDVIKVSRRTVTNVEVGDTTTAFYLKNSDTAFTHFNSVRLAVYR